ncbi:hypothetical protein [Uliginosibacterium sp. TH139]|uniref:hypothetical protein n=1 Tax=Uliginosibacterium sp. TH139 TaxID=2067453 RepID=UPI000C7A4CD9|nr:hypothetical protein [Uliginosibacterium sp. TH139]PLK50859.1 hypothetical protein C0V76_03390 [Uliginosibacterium sp. TH139]
MAPFRLSCSLLCLPALAACSLLADKPEPPPAPPPAPAPQVIVEPPPPPPPPAPTKPVTKAKPAPKSSKVSSKPSTPEAAPSAVAPATSAKAVTRKAAAPIQGPDWLQYCSARQQSPTGILCDANTLLAQPSAKVQVYVREAALVRDTPSGRIQLREGLPRLYRFFVIP